MSAELAIDGVAGQATAPCGARRMLDDRIGERERVTPFSDMRRRGALPPRSVGRPYAASQRHACPLGAVLAIAVAIDAARDAQNRLAPLPVSVAGQIGCTLQAIAARLIQGSTRCWDARALRCEGGTDQGALQVRDAGANVWLTAPDVGNPVLAQTSLLRRERPSLVAQLQRPRQLFALGSEVRVPTEARSGARVSIDDLDREAGEATTSRIDSVVRLREPVDVVGSPIQIDEKQGAEFRLGVREARQFPEFRAVLTSNEVAASLWRPHGELDQYRIRSAHAKIDSCRSRVTGKRGVELPFH